MFQVDSYHIRFVHRVGIGVTLCLIYDNDKLPVQVGAAYCSKKDHYDRKVGRKVALARALKDTPREYRKKVWDAYFAVLGGHDVKRRKN